MTPNKTYRFSSFKKLFLVFLSCLVLFSFPGKCLSYQIGRRGEEENRYFFWEVSSEDNKVYILGSIHVAREGLYPLSRDIEEAFDRSDVLVVEVDLTEIDEFEAAKGMLSRAIYQDGSSLSGRLSPDIYRQAEEVLSGIGLDIRMFDMYQPWFLAVSITSYALMGLGFQPEWGVDQYFLDKAQDAGKKIKGLETMEFQLDLFSGLSDDLQELFLLSSLAEIETIEKHMDMLFDIWKKGNTRRLNTILRRSLAEYPQLEPFYERVIDQRNKNMASQIEDYLGQDNLYFVVVGAGHLIGSEGIIQILRERGYRARQY